MIEPGVDAIMYSICERFFAFQKSYLRFRRHFGLEIGLVVEVNENAVVRL